MKTEKTECFCTVQKSRMELKMVYISFYFYVFVGGVVLLYYVFPKKYRWLVLLAGSLGFYYKISGKGWWVFGITLLAGYGMGILLERVGKKRDGIKTDKKEKAEAGEGRKSGEVRKDGKGRESRKVEKAGEDRESGNVEKAGEDRESKTGRKNGTGRVEEATGKWILVICLVLLAAPMAVVKNGNFVLASLLHKKAYPWIVPVGISFYTMQMISYLVDVYSGKIPAQRNLGKFALFVSFFPQIVQGPIPRYGQLGDQLYEGNGFSEEGFGRGLLLIVWGFFLKLVIADRAAIVVNQVFSHHEAYQGAYVFVAGALYSVQLYADFLACVCLSRGTAELFGIHLAENFRQPYLAETVKEFWGRWHISLSNWLRDYVYIPLGGNKKGKLRKYFNILVVFTVSGIWHGPGYKYIFWGWMHGIYQICGELTGGLQDKVYGWLHMPEKGKARRWCRRFGTWFWVMVAWIIFRADSLHKGIAMVAGMFMVYNPWIFFDDSLLRLGLSWKEWGILLVSIAVLGKADRLQETVDVRERILKQPLVIRWGFYIGVIGIIMVFGSYGFGFNGADFIYGGF